MRAWLFNFQKSVALVLAQLIESSKHQKGLPPSPVDVSEDPMEINRRKWQAVLGHGHGGRSSLNILGKKTISLNSNKQQNRLSLDGSLIGGDDTGTNSGNNESPKMGRTPTSCRPQNMVSGVNLNKTGSILSSSVSRIHTMDESMLQRNYRSESTGGQSNNTSALTGSLSTSSAIPIMSHQQHAYSMNSGGTGGMHNNTGMSADGVHSRRGSYEYTGGFESNVGRSSSSEMPSISGSYHEKLAGSYKSPEQFSKLENLVMSLEATNDAESVEDDDDDSLELYEGEQSDNDDNEE